MRLDHLLSKETSINETLDRKFLWSVMVPGHGFRCLILRVQPTVAAHSVRHDRQRKLKRRLVGGLAQLGERLPCKQEVSGSIPLISTRAAVTESSLLQRTGQ